MADIKSRIVLMKRDYKHDSSMEDKMIMYVLNYSLLGEAKFECPARAWIDCSHIKREDIHANYIAAGEIFLTALDYYESVGISINSVLTGRLLGYDTYFNNGTPLDFRHGVIWAKKCPTIMRAIAALMNHAMEERMNVGYRTHMYVNTNTAYRVPIEKITIVESVTSLYKKCEITIYIDDCTEYDGSLDGNLYKKDHMARSWEIFSKYCTDISMNNSSIKRIGKKYDEKYVEKLMKSVDAVRLGFENSTFGIIDSLSITRGPGGEINMFEIKDIKFNNMATIVLWKDGTKTVVAMGDDEDKYDVEKAIFAAFTKKALSTFSTSKERSIDNLLDKVNEFYKKSEENEKKKKEKQAKKAAKKKEGEGHWDIF